MSFGNKLLSGVLWSGIEKLSVQSASFVIGVLLARLLTPSEYGTIGLLIVFISFSQVFIDGGFSKALIQNQERTDTDFSTVFFINGAVAIFCCLVLWFIAPWVAKFYEITNLDLLLRVLSISLVFNALFTVPHTILSISMNFKEITKVTLTSIVISGLIAVYLAYKGYGVWALVWQTIIRSFLMMLIIWLVVKWRPDFKFSKESFRKLFGFGSKLLLSSLLNNITNNLSSLFIGKVLNTKQLGLYTRGTQFADTLFTTLNTILNNVLLPGLAPLQNDIISLTRMTRRIIKSSSILVVPMFFGLAALAEPIILLLIGEKWEMAVPVMQIICIARMITIISGVNVNLLYVIGRSDLALQQQYYKIAIRIILLLISIKFGIVAIALAELVSTSIHFFINSYYPGKIMGYGSIKQLKDLYKIAITGILMATMILFICEFVESKILSILISIITGSLFYFSFLKILRVEEFSFLYDRIKALLIKKN